MKSEEMARGEMSAAKHVFDNLVGGDYSNGRG